MVKRIGNQRAVGASQPFVDTTPEPIIARRSPGVNDTVQRGRLWINRITDQAYVLSSVVNNQANWQGFANTTLTTLNGLLITSGNGDPSGIVSAPQGSLYLNTAGNGQQNRAFINTNGGLNWTAVNTVT